MPRSVVGDYVIKNEKGVIPPSDTASMLAVVERLERGEEVEPEEILSLLVSEDPLVEGALQSSADCVRAATVGDEVHLRGIIEFSNYCCQNCHYCGLRRDNKSLPRYRLTTEEIIAAAGVAYQFGLKTVVLQSGEDPGLRVDELARVVATIKERWGMAVTLSLGELTYHDYCLLRRAGADRYLLKHETADAELFARLRPGRTLNQRLRCLYWLQELGYQVGSGCIVGLPGQSLTSLVEDLLLLRRLKVSMVGIGPLVPAPGTPLAAAVPGSVTLTLKMIALVRLLLPDCHIPATTALATLSPEGRRRALQGGANVVMPNLTPPAYRRAYAIYPKPQVWERSVSAELQSVRELLAAIGRPEGRDYGHARRPRQEV